MTNMMTDPLTQLDLRVETITPQDAQQYLELNDNPRRPSESTVARYAADMSVDAWTVGSGQIVFDTKGHLRDGQHRLLACIASGKPFTTVVLRNITDDAVDNIDRGRKRNIAHILHNRGETNVNQLQAAIGVAWRWDTGAILNSRGPTGHQSIVWLEANPDIRTAVSDAAPLTRRPLRIKMSIAAAWLLRIRRIDPAGAEEFLLQVLSGIDLAPNSPALRLREVMFSRRPGQRREADLALMVKAWNAFVTDRPVGVLKWISRGDRTEDFPQLLDIDGTVYPFPEVS